ncbi:hypothetical protein [Pedobacter sp. Hv1]|nr:hypothetical protein [Pedobacter sp. Hv1]
MQIEFDNEMRVLFSGGELLNDMILKIGRENCPVRTTIKKVNRHYELS